MVYPEKVVALLRRPCFHPIKCVKTTTVSHSVNSKDFLAAANDGQIQASTRCDLPRDTPSRCKRQHRQHLLRELATITDVTVLQMEHCAITNGRKRRQRMAFRLQVRDNVKRFDTIFNQIRPCSSSMNSRISSKTSGVKRRSTPNVATGLLA